ncbi:MAG: hypothetical protein P1U64_11740 [Alcanivoracaceae bacterium]|nr:hypothetical protein [Alcanivoracaceae bacterium]
MSAFLDRGLSDADWYKVQKAAKDWSSQLIQIQNEVTYVIECLVEDYRAEARRGMKDAYDCLRQSTLPESWQARIEEMLDAAVPPLNSRHLVSCARKLSALRRVLANEVAWFNQVKLPYSDELYPALDSVQTPS